MINEQIRDREVRVIGEDGEQLGIMSPNEAMKLAEEAGVDLVKIATAHNRATAHISATAVRRLMIPGIKDLRRSSLPDQPLKPLRRACRLPHRS